MRISHKEQRAILGAFEHYFGRDSYQIFLYGSRADDKKKGGDIDLLIVTQETLCNKISELKTKIRSRIFETLPEQRIDITVVTQDQISNDPFLQSIWPNAILLSDS